MSKSQHIKEVLEHDEDNSYEERLILGAGSPQLQDFSCPNGLTPVPV